MIADDDRYIIAASLYVGSHLKVMANIEGDEVEITAPARDSDDDIAPFDFAQGYPSEAVVYPSSWSATAPTIDAAKGWNRVWRIGLILSCDKDVPEIAETKQGAAATFIQDLEAAFGTKLVELGWLH